MKSTWILVFALLLAGVLSVEKNEFWPMGHHDAQNSGRSDYYGITKDYIVQEWSFHAPGLDEYFTQTGVVGLIHGEEAEVHFAASSDEHTGKGVVYCLNITSGAVIFSFMTDNPISTSPLVIKSNEHATHLLVVVDDGGVLYSKIIHDCIEHHGTDCDYVAPHVVSPRPTGDPVYFIENEELMIFIPAVNVTANESYLIALNDSGLRECWRQRMPGASLSEVALTSDGDYLWWASQSKIACILRGPHGASRPLAVEEIAAPETFASGVVLNVDEDIVLIMTSAGRLVAYDVTYNLTTTEVTMKRKYMCLYTTYDDANCCYQQVCDPMTFRVDANPEPTIPQEGSTVIVSVAKQQGFTGLLGGIYKVDIENGNIIWAYDADDIDLDVQATVDSFGIVYSHIIMGKSSAFVAIDGDPDPRYDSFVPFERIFKYFGRESVRQTGRILVYNTIDDGKVVPHLLASVHDEIRSYKGGFACPSDSDFDHCSGHGTCNHNTGYCKCNEPWSGDDCSDVIAPVYPMVHHDPHNSGRVDFAGPRLSEVAETWQWGEETGALILGEFIRHSGVLGFGLGNDWHDILYVGTNKGILHAIDTERTIDIPGSIPKALESWKITMGGDIIGSPAVFLDANNQEIVIAGSTNGNLSAFRSEDCSRGLSTCLLWTMHNNYPVTGDLIVTYGVFGALYYVSTHPDNVTVEVTSRDLNTGKEFWSHTIKNTTNIVPDYFQFAPAVDDRRVYIAFDCGLYVLDALDGDETSHASCPGVGSAGLIDHFASDVTVSDDEEHLFVQLESGRAARYDINKFGKGEAEIDFVWACKAQYPNSDCCTLTASACGYRVPVLPPHPLPSPSLDPWGDSIVHTQFRIDGSVGPQTGVFLMSIENGKTYWELTTDLYGRKLWSKTAPTVDLTGMSYIVGHNNDKSIFIGMDMFPAPDDIRGNVIFEHVLDDTVRLSEFGQETILLRVGADDHRRMIVTTLMRIYEFEESILCPSDHPYLPCSGNGTCDGATGVCSCILGHYGVGCEFQNGVPTYQCPSNDSVLSCSGHGDCKPLTGECLCHQDYYGSGCDIHSPCPSVDGLPCGGREFGTCMEGVCRCVAGFTGPACMLTCPSSAPDNFCSGHGVCNSVSQECRCDDGFYGLGCEFEVHHDSSSDTPIEHGEATGFGVSMVVICGIAASVVGILLYLKIAGGVTFAALAVAGAGAGAAQSGESDAIKPTYTKYGSSD